MIKGKPFPAIFTNDELSNEEYHASEAIGSSGLKAFAECPKIYWHEYLNPENQEERKKSKSTNIGTHAHITLLEPEKFNKEYIVAPETCPDGTTKEVRKLDIKTIKGWKDFEKKAEEEGKTPLLWKEYQQLLGMANAIKNHELAYSMLTNGSSEMSFFATDPETGLLMKARPDYLTSLPGHGVILVDYKTTEISLHTTRQSNHAFNLKRHIQAIHHKTVTELASKGEISEVVYITQTQKAPHLVRVFRMPAEALSFAQDERRMYLNGMAECHTTNKWPEYPQEIEDYVMPKYMDYQFN